MSRPTDVDWDLVNQWIVYLIGQQPDGPLSLYTAGDQQASYLVGFTDSPRRASTNAKLVSKTVSADVVQPLRRNFERLTSLVKDLKNNATEEANLVRRARAGEVIPDIKREPTVDLEDLDAFLAAADAPPPTPAPVASLDHQCADRIVSSIFGSGDKTSLNQRDDAEGRSSFRAALQTFVQKHNLKLQAPPKTVTTSVGRLLGANSSEALQSLVAADLADTINASTTEEESYLQHCSQLAAKAKVVEVDIAECDTLSLKGALAAEMAAIEERLREVATMAAQSMLMAQQRMESLRNEVGLQQGWSSMVTSSIMSQSPKDVLATLTSGISGPVEQFKRDALASLHSRASVVERQGGHEGDSLIAEQQARKFLLQQEAEDLRALIGVTDRSLQTIRSTFANRDRPAAQGEHDKWQAYVKHLESIRDGLTRNFEARAKYDAETQHLRSAQRALLPPPPTRFAVRLPEAPADPRPNAAKGGLHHLPRTWREKYSTMPPAALLSSQPRSLWSQAQLTEDARKRQAEQDDTDGDTEPAHPQPVFADLVDESEKLRRELSDAMKRMKSKEQCHSALLRQSFALLPRGHSFSSSTDAATQKMSAAAARQSLLDIVQRYS